MKTRKPIHKLTGTIAALMMILCTQTAAYADKIFNIKERGGKMKKGFFYGMVLFCMSFMLMSCKFTISTFTAPSTANTGEVITLSITGNHDGSSGECGLILQIPANWEVISATGTPSLYTYTLYEQSRYTSLYTAPSGYKIWVGTADTHSGDSTMSVSATVKILTGRTPTGASGTSQNYDVKIAVGAVRNGAWVTDDPANVYNFSQITGDKYAKTISVTNVNITDSVPPASVTQTQLIVKDYNTGTDVNLTLSGYDEAGQKDVVKYRIYQSTANFTNVSNMTYIGETPIDSYGNFSYDISNLTPGTTYYFAVTATDEVSNENKAVSTVFVTPQRKVGGISGQAFYSDCTVSPCVNKGVAGAKITVQNDSLSSIKATAVSDSAGNFVLGNLPIGKYLVYIDAEGYGYSSYPVDVLENQTVLIPNPLSPDQIGLSGNLAFGNVYIGSTSTKTLTIKNVGTSPLTVKSLSYPEAFTGDWNGGTIPAGGSQNVNITFAPTAPKPYNSYCYVYPEQSSGSSRIETSGYGIRSGTSVYTISGSVKTSSGTVISGVTMTLSTGATATTDSSGNYSFSNIAAGSSGTVKASKSGYTFTPASQSFSSISANQTLNFTGWIPTTCSQWNLFKDILAYPNQENPNRDSCGNTGVWHFMRGQTHQPSTYTLLGIYFDNGLGGVSGIKNIPGWIKLANEGPYIALNRTGNTVTSTEGIVIPAGTAFFHPYLSEDLVIGWRSPIDGTVSITGSSKKLDWGIVPWFIDKGTTKIASGNSDTQQIFQNATDGGSSLSRVQVSKGDFIYFNLNPGGYYGDTTALDISITTVNGYTISGSVKTSSGAAMSGVTMTLSSGATTTTDSSGNYSFSNIAAGSSGTVKASKSGYAFTQSSLSFSNLYANQTLNFIGNPITYTVTFIAGSGGKLSGAITQTVNQGSGTTAVTPIPNTGYQFVNWSNAGSGVFTAVTTNPLVLANVTSNMTLTANFRQLPDTITRIINLSGSLSFGKVNVGSTKQLTYTISNTGKLPLTVSSIAYPKGFTGNWSGGTIAAGGSQNVIVTFLPTKADPYTSTVTLNSDKTSGTNTISVSGTGVAVPISYTISGYVKDSNNVAMSGVTMTFSNNGGMVTTNSSGNYSKTFTSLWTGDVKPSNILGYFAAPIIRSYSNVTTNQTNQNFMLTQMLPISSFRVWIDKNGNSVYDAGEEVAAAYVRVNNETTYRGITDSQGIIKLTNISNDARIYAEKLFYSANNPKAVDSNFANSRGKNPYYAVSFYADSINGKMYNFVMASDIMAADGTYYDFPGQGKTLANVSKDSQGYTLIRLVHPKIEWNLVITFEEPQSADFYNKIKAGLRSYADYMYNYTDGYALLKNVVLVKGAYINSAQWNYSDVQVRNVEWPNAHVFGNRKNETTRISMGKDWGYAQPDGYGWYSTLGHESGHYLFGFGDEYVNGDYTKGVTIDDLYIPWPYRTSHDGDKGESDEFPKNYGLMDFQYNAHEMSDVTDYYPRTYSSSMNPDLVTNQFLSRQGQSCWSYFKSYYQNDIKQQMAGQGFSDAFFSNLIIPPHTSGSYPGNPITNTPKRNGPTAMNHDSVSIIEWTLPGASLRDNHDDDVFDAVAVVADEAGNAVVGANVWLNSPSRKSFQGKSDQNGVVKCGSLFIGKRLEAYYEGRKAEVTIDAVREAYVLTLPADRIDKRDDASGMIISAKPDSANPKHLTITASGSSVSSAPNIILSQSEGYSVNVTMNSSGSNLYSGEADCQDDSGILQVSSGTSDSVTPFEIFSTEIGPASGYYAPNGELQMSYSPTTFTGTGSFLITNSSMPAPPNNGLIQIGSVYSFGFSDTVTSVKNVILTIRIPSGVNTSQLNLYGWDIQSKTWNLIQGGQSSPKYFSISVASLDYAAYALFATPQTNSFMPPDSVAELTVSTGTAASGINLQWTEPSSAVSISVYDIRFNTVPVTDDNWNNSISLGNVPKPVSAGTVQSFTAEMPDAGVIYYFGIKAIDVAGNMSLLTLSFPATSLAKDTDGDGMPDIWEIAHGLDPNVNDAQNDDDGDGLSNLQEYLYHTDPKNSDTDGDGYSDGDEVAKGTDPNNPKIFPSTVSGDLDCDGDAGLSDAIIVLQITAGIDSPSVFCINDMNNDKKIGMEEVIYILQKVAGLRPSTI